MNIYSHVTSLCPSGQGPRSPHTSYESIPCNPQCTVVPQLTLPAVMLISFCLDFPKEPSHVEIVAAHHGLSQPDLLSREHMHAVTPRACASKVVVRVLGPRLWCLLLMCTHGRN